MVQVSNPPLAGARVLVAGVANAGSMAWGCALPGEVVHIMA